MPQGSRSGASAPASSPLGETPFVHPSRLLKQAGLRARRGLSQSFLAQDGIARAIADAAELGADDEVLEVGPGLGIMTRHLVHQARRIVAVELDRELAERLAEQVGAPNLEVRTQDVLQFSPGAAFAQPFVVVANLPYHITSAATRHLLESGPPFARRLVVMVQREVAERIAAAPGAMSALAVSVQVQARVRIVRRVPPSAFYPPPKVHSAVLRIDPFSDSERQVRRDEMETFVDLLHAGFAQPRKTLANSLSHGLQVAKLEAERLIQAAGLDASLRPEAFEVGQWVQLFRAALGSDAVWPAD